MSKRKSNSGRSINSSNRRRKFQDPRNQHSQGKNPSTAISKSGVSRSGQQGRGQRPWWFRRARNSRHRRGTMEASINHPCTTAGAVGQSSWFWENYNNAMEWQQRHFLSYWKTRCAALEAENSHLYSCVEDMRRQLREKGGDACGSSHKVVAENSHQVPKTQETAHQSSAQVETEFEEHHEFTQVIKTKNEEKELEFDFTVHDGMLEFLEISAKHKIELKKLREEEQREEEEAEKKLEEEKKQLRFPQESLQKRRDEMALLYGPASSMILSMETAMQLNYDRFCDKHHPKPWPNIPLNL